MILEHHNGTTRIWITADKIEYHPMNDTLCITNGQTSIVVEHDSARWGFYLVHALILAIGKDNIRDYLDTM